MVVVKQESGCEVGGCGFYAQESRACVNSPVPSTLLGIWCVNCLRMCRQFTWQQYPFTYVLPAVWWFYQCTVYYMQLKVDTYATHRLYVTICLCIIHAECIRTHLNKIDWR